MSVFATFSLLVVLLAAGKLLARVIGPDPVRVDVAADVLNRLGINLFFPAAILLHAPALRPGVELLGLVAIPWIVLAAAAVVAVVARKLLDLDGGTAACVLLALGFGNTAFLGYAVVPALLGEHALPYAVVYDQLGSFVALSTVGIVVVAVAGGQQRPSLLVIARKIVTFPPLLALVVAVTVMPQQPPADLTKALATLAGALLPCMAVAVGLRLRFTLPAHHRAPLVIVVVGKLVAAPALALLLARAFGLDGVVADVAVVQAAMPVMVTLAALMAVARVVPELAASVVAFSTLASMITLPLWHRLLSSSS